MFSAICVISLLIAATSDPVRPTGTNWHERYIYETFKADDTSSAVVERVTMQYMTTNGTLYMHYRSGHSKGAEEITIRCDVDGSNVVATRQEFTTDGKLLSDARTWVEGEKVHVEQLLDGNRKKVRTRESGGKPVAAEASLMALFRFFPFDKGVTQQVLIATFTQHFVTMEVKQIGSETITVPGGKIECYKLEGVVDLFVTSIKTVYWLNKKEPHYLVKYEGKRGLFLAPTYVTALAATGDLAETNAALPSAVAATNHPPLPQR